MLAEKYGTLEQAKANATKPMADDFWLNELDWTIKGMDEHGNPLPAWYINSNGGRGLTAKKELAHKLLKLEWEGQPIAKTKKNGYCYADKAGKEHKLPHKDGSSNVGNPLAPFYQSFIESGTMSSSEQACAELMQSLQQCSFYIGYKNRLAEVAAMQMQNPANGAQALAIAPSICPANTLSLRTGK